MSSFNGKICEIPSICVDNFENPHSDGAKSYFLSHFHTDHTVGLDRDALRNKLEREHNVFIYATKMTAAIIVHRNPDLKDYVKVLKLGPNLISIPGNETESELIVNVTLIPAGHCLGSTMFLFETTSVKVLFTGDFRIRPNDLSKYAAFHNTNGDVIKLDALYVDTTFLNSHESFPKRSESIQEVMEWIRSFLDSHEDQFVILDISAYYGYEYVFNKIYELLGIKVYVDDRRWTFYSTIQNLVKGVTNNPHETRVFLRNVPESRKLLLPPKKIRFSAMRWQNWDEENTSLEENGNNVYVCFATHCSRIELISFVEYLNPSRVVGFPFHYTVVTPRKESNGEKFALSPKKSPTKVPSLLKNLRKDKKVDRAVLNKIFG